MIYKLLRAHKHGGGANTVRKFGKSENKPHICELSTISKRPDMQKALALLLSAAMLLCLHPAAAQQPNTLTGTVTDSASGKAVGYATVSLQRDSVTVVNAVAANSDGRFSLKAPETGDYQLCITMVGYTPYKQAVEVPASGKALGKIAITQGVEVGDVVIEVQKPLVMADAEKTTYSVEDDPQASTSTLDEIDPQGSAALARRRRQRPAQRTEQLQDIAQRAQFGNDEQQFQGCDPEHARLADQPHRGHHQPLDQVRSRRRGRHHQPHHPTQEAVPRIQRQRRRERHGVGEPGLQRQRQPLDPGREVRGEHHGLCRLLRRGPYPLGIGVVAGKLRLGEPLQPQLLRKQGQLALRQRRTGHELPARHAQPDHAQRMAVARPQPLQIAGYERDPRPRNEPAAGIRQPQHPEMELHGRQRLAQLRTHLRQGGAYADHIG